VQQGVQLVLGQLAPQSRDLLLVGLVLVEQDKLRVDVGFDGELVQEPRTETVNRGNDRAFECAFMTQPGLPLAVGYVAQQPIDAIANALTHLPMPRVPDARNVSLHVATACLTCWPQSAGFRLPVTATSVSPTIEATPERGCLDSLPSADSLSNSSAANTEHAPV